MIPNLHGSDKDETPQVQFQNLTGEEIDNIEIVEAQESPASILGFDPGSVTLSTKRDSGLGPDGKATAAYTLRFTMASGTTYNASVSIMMGQTVYYAAGQALGGFSIDSSVSTTFSAQAGNIINSKVPGYSSAQTATITSVAQTMLTSKALDGTVKVQISATFQNPPDGVSNPTVALGVGTGISMSPNNWKGGNWMFSLSASASEVFTSGTADSANIIAGATVTIDNASKSSLRVPLVRWGIGVFSKSSIDAGKWASGEFIFEGSVFIQFGPPPQ